VRLLKRRQTHPIRVCCAKMYQYQQNPNPNPNLNRDTDPNSDPKFSDE